MPIPSCTGPFKVGCVDILTKAASIPPSLDTYSVCAADSGVLMRLFYPCAQDESKNELAKWLPEPGQKWYSYGILKHVNMTWFNWILHAFTKNIKMHAYKNVKIIDHTTWKNEQHIECLKSNDRLPLVVFSHGLAGQRGMYSTYCAQLASEGFVVAAVEHRDTSATATFLMDDDDKLVEVPYHVCTTVDDDDNGEVLKLRQTQLNKRTQEISAAIDVLENLNQSETFHNLLDKGNEENMFKCRLDTSSILMMGHSFGGATTVNALKQDSRLKCGIGLDVWFVPLPKEFYEKNEKTEKPLLMINTEFFNWKKNLARCEKYMKNTTKDWIEMITLRGTDHYAQCDIPGIVPSFIHPWMEKKVDFRLDFPSAVAAQRKIITEYFVNFLSSEGAIKKLVDDSYTLPDVFIRGSNITLDEEKEEEVPLTL